MGPPAKKPKLDATKKKGKSTTVKKETTSENSPSTSSNISPPASVEDLRLIIENERKQVRTI